MNMEMLFVFGVVYGLTAILIVGLILFIKKFNNMCKIVEDDHKRANKKTML